MTSVVSESAQEFWTEYQPGFRVSDAPVGTLEFYSAVQRDRYLVEPDIPEMAGFRSWRDHDVLEAGCGIATDGVQFARAGARYTGIDFSPTAVRLARQRFEMQDLPGRFAQGSIVELPFDDASFDLVYSMGVIHHLPDTERAVSEFHRVLRPGGRAIVMVYHRDSFNYRFTILTLRRALVASLLLPNGPSVVARLTRERRDVLEGHHRLVCEHGLTYLRDRRLFLSNNTDGPGNPLSKVYGREDARLLFAQFEEVCTTARFLHLRSYPGGARLARTALAQRLASRWGWHLWIDARKAQARSPDVDSPT
jgi:SAM-dependent methyltransferase